MKKDSRSAWEQRATYVQTIYGVYVDWEERFYTCPECGEPVYECDWSDDELLDYFCPICEWIEEEGEEDF